MCGGTTALALQNAVNRGLSPRVRGNPLIVAVVMSLSGSIPACAGEPRISGRAAEFHRVYPRVCGGTPGVDKRLGTGVGLSPRVRGNLPGHSGPQP